MLAWDHGGGFSLVASVRLEAMDRAGLERLIRYCARPPFDLGQSPEFEPAARLAQIPTVASGSRRAPGIPSSS